MPEGETELTPEQKAALIAKKKETDRLEKERLEAEKNKIPALDITEEDKIFNKENFDRLLNNVEELTKYTVGKDIEAKRKIILDEIKTLDPEEYEEQKDNHSHNELQFLLKGLRKAKPKKKQIPQRDAGATTEPEGDKPINTQIDTVLNKAIPG